METSKTDFDVLWTQMHDRLCWFVCSRVFNAQDAEDLLQEVFLRVYTRSSELRNDQRLEPWMYQIARNRIIDYYRARRLWVDLPETLRAIDSDLLPEDGLFSEDAVLHGEGEPLVAYLRDAVTSLKETDREALIEVDVKGLDQKDLAVKMGISLPGAKSRVQRARRKVKEVLLHCFELEFDTRGQIMDYRRRCCC